MTSYTCWATNVKSVTCNIFPRKVGPKYATIRRHSPAMPTTEYQAPRVNVPGMVGRFQGLIKYFCVRHCIPRFPTCPFCQCSRHLYFVPTTILVSKKESYSQFSFTKFLFSGFCHSYGWLPVYFCAMRHKLKSLRWGVGSVPRKMFFLQTILLPPSAGLELQNRSFMV